MKKDFKGLIDLEIYTNDAPEAKNYELRGATNVFVNGTRVHLLTAISNDKMRAYLKAI